MTGVQIDPALEKATLKNPSLIRVNDCFRQLLPLQTNILAPIKISPPLQLSTRHSISLFLGYSKKSFSGFPLYFVSILLPRAVNPS